MRAESVESLPAPVDPILNRMPVESAREWNRKRFDTDIHTPEFEAARADRIAELTRRYELRGPSDTSIFDDDDRGWLDRAVTEMRGTDGG